MPISSNLKSTRWLPLSLVAAFALVSFGLVRHIHAQETMHSSRIYAVTHVDILPPDAAAGTKLLQQYIADSRKDKGAVRIEAYAQIGRTNHLTLIEVWETQEAFDAHVGAEHTRKFRQQLDPMLGSPYDERLHQLLE
jgi:quinol monooxygenase YgiN